MNWQEEVARVMLNNGFVRGKYNPCLYYHRERGLRTLLHGDDFATVGTRSAVCWLKGVLESRFEIKTQCVGPAKVLGGRGSLGSGFGPEGLQEETECRILNRVVRCTDSGWEIEPDQRHADLIVQELQLEGANRVTTPGEHEPRRKEGENEEELEPWEATRYRAITARANYLTADRPDIMYSVKELCRGMAKPTKAHWHKLKRLGRYLVDNGRTVFRYDWQGHESEVTGYTDSDWVGCRVTGKSTSGGALMIGSHFIKGWSRTQNNVTTSSAGTELVAMVKGVRRAPRSSNRMKDLGRDSSGVIYADSSAALAIAKRKGAGKLRHINVSSLWIQERQDKGEMEYRKVLGTENPSDLMTKYLARQSMDGCMDALGQARVAGRARTGLEVQGTGQRSTEIKVARCHEVEDDWMGPQRIWPQKWIG